MNKNKKYSLIFISILSILFIGFYFKDFLINSLSEIEEQKIEKQKIINVVEKKEIININNNSENINIDEKNYYNEIINDYINSDFNPLKEPKIQYCNN